MNNAEEVPAWRIDFSLLFEKFVQYIFRRISREIGARQYENYKIHRLPGYNPQWSLRYLEPDIFIDKSYFSIIVDAKYKSHLYNFQSLSESLRETHREDLHQILAYSSFTHGDNKLCFLCYPQENVYSSELDYFSNLTQINTKLVLLGIPLSKSEIPTIRGKVRSIITEYETSIHN